MTADRSTVQNQGWDRITILIGVAVIILGCLAPFVIYPVFLMKMLCFALFASAFNLVFGYAGLLSFGHAMFFGVGCYATGYMMKEWGVSAELSILAGVVLGAIFGLVAGVLAIGRQGIAFAMITLALAQMFFFFCLKFPAAGGDNGISAIPRQPLLGMSIESDLRLYYIVLLLVLLGMLLIYRTIHSPFGQVLKGIRDNEPRMISLGYHVRRYKILAFVISAALSGLAGSLKVVVFQLATLADVSWTTSGDVVLMTLIGGIGTFIGPAVGSAVIIAMNNYMTGLGEWLIAVQGLIFFVAVLTFRRGIVGEIEEFTNRRKKAKRSQSRPLAKIEA